MRHAIQVIRDIAEELSLRCAEVNDRDSAEAYENIGLRLGELDKAIASDWRIIQERQPTAARGVLAHIAGNMHAALCAETR